MIFLLWATLVFSPDTHAQSTAAPAFDLPTPQRITDQDGLPQAFVSAIVQDRQGFIWAATRDGLCRYDGANFKVFQPDPNGRPSLSYAGISNLTLDHHGRIWIASERGDLDLLDPLTETFVNISRQPVYLKRMNGRRLSFFRVDRRERLWMVPLDAAEVIRYDFKTRQTKRFFFWAESGAVARHDTIADIVEGASGRIWLSTTTGLKYLDPETDHFQEYALPEDAGRFPLRLYARPTGEILLFYPNHLIRLRHQTGALKRYPHQADDSSWQNRNFIEDQQGRVYFNHSNTLFAFTEGGGVKALASREPERKQEFGTRLWLDRSEVLWEGTDGAGIRRYNLSPNPFRTTPYIHSFHADLRRELGLDRSKNRAPSLDPANGRSSYQFRYTYDGNVAGRRSVLSGLDSPSRTLWFNVGSSDIYQLDLQTKRITEHPLPVSFQSSFSDGIPCPLATDPEGKVWAVYDSLVWQYDKESNQWLRFPHQIPHQRTGDVLMFTVDEQALWLATRQEGLWRLDRKTGQLRQYANQPSDPRSLSSDVIFCLSADPADPNRLWLGTFGSGLCAFDKRTGYFRRFTVADGLPNNVVYSVIPDQQGYLWMGTNKGLCRMDRRTFATTNFTTSHGLLADEFNRFHWLQTRDGEILMGGLEGTTAFYPDQIVDDTFDTPVALTGLRINNHPAAAALLDSLPTQAVQKIRLAYDQNFVTAEFAALQFNRPAVQRSGENRYRYRLEGLEEGWTESTLPLATYTNLSPGEYVLLLNASNTSGRWSEQLRRLAITIRPPFWATWWAYLLYALAVGGLLFLGNRLYFNRLKMRQNLALREREVALSQQESEQLRAVDEMKSDFFANMTHEFRTPLTLILAPTEQLQQQLTAPEHQRRLSTINRNAHQLLGLVNQLLDFSKLEAGALPVVEVRGNVQQFVAQTVDSFRELADAKGIELTFECQELAIAYWFDSDKLERILYNLLANALNHTEEGKISVKLNGGRPTGLEEGVRLTVEDTGRGIPAGQLPRIFERYYRVETAESDASSGTGLGLALVRELVDLQKGKISVTSEEGQGTTFVLELPFQPVTMVFKDPATTKVCRNKDHGEGTDHGDELLSPRPATDAESPLVLVVEDNDELARYIAESLPADYRVQRAADGQQGWEMALAELPDLVLSDVMMPVMDGYALCQKLKTDLRTSHIPVLMLTAKAALDDRLEGLTLGADDYLTKPFQEAELLLRVRNQLESRRKLRERLRAELTLSENAEADQLLAETSDPFLRQLYGLLEAQLDNPEFGVEQLLEPLGMSRTTLYRKLMSLTDMTPTDLLRHYRLRRAAHYLRQGMSATDTAYKVGFQTPSHFTRVFRQQYQMTPGQFARQRPAS